MQTIIARWQTWSQNGLEHLVLKTGEAGIEADSALIGITGSEQFAARYRLSCNQDWAVRRIKIEIIGREDILEFKSNGSGEWKDRNDNPQPQFQGAIDIDISATPFTNSLPVNRLKLNFNKSQDLLVVYINLPDLNVNIDRQRYTCLETGRLYKFESLDLDFSQILEMDRDGLVLSYPGLFRRS